MIKKLKRKTKRELIQMIKDEHVHRIVKKWGESYYDKSTLIDILITEKEFNIPWS